MKKKKLLSILLLAVFTLPLMVSCGGDDEDDSLAVTKENLVGSWCHDNNKGIKELFIFKADGTGSYAYYLEGTLRSKMSYVFTYSLNEYTLTLSNLENFEEKPISGQGVYQVTMYKNRMELKRKDSDKATSYDLITR